MSGLEILSKAANSVLQKEVPVPEVGCNRISNLHKNVDASATGFFKKGSVNYEVEKSFLSCLSEDRYCFINWIKDLSLVLFTWQCSVPSDVDNPIFNETATIVKKISNRLLLKAMNEKKWEPFYEEIKVVIREILKKHQQSEGNEEGIDDFAEFVQYIFNTYYQYGRSIRNRYCWFD